MLLESVNTLLRDRAVSDIHVEVGKPVWARHNGEMLPSGAQVSSDDLEEFFTKILPQAELNRLQDDLVAKGDGDFATYIGRVRIRGNLYSANGGMHSFAVRKLSDHIPKPSEIGLPDKLLQIFDRSKGLFLVTGATGHGKTTTLGSVIDYLNETRRLQITTIEDPREYLFTDKQSKVSQKEVGKDAPTFRAALRSALRQDPDVLVIGEMRDRETVETAVQAANTGHLVLATLHTFNAQQSIERIASFYSAEEKEWAHKMLSSVLLGVMSQCLVPLADGSGRTLCYELLVNTKEAAVNIASGKTAALFNTMDMGRRDGHVLLNHNLIEKVRGGIISIEDARYATYDQTNLDKEIDNAY
jgi:twitching motility protein PilT